MPEFLDVLDNFFPKGSFFVKFSVISKLQEMSQKISHGIYILKTDLSVEKFDILKYIYITLEKRQIKILCDEKSILQ